MRLCDLGEDEVLKTIIAKYLNGTIGNDVEFVNIEGVKLAFKIDGFAISRIKLPFMDMYDVGWKAIAAVVSDFIAKLSRPYHVLISLTLRAVFKVDDLKDLLNGVKDACREFNVLYIGGDLNEGDDDVIDVACIGKPLLGEIPRRPREGDVLMTLPIFGYTGLVFALLRRNLLEHHAKSPVVMKGISILKRPRPPIGLLNHVDESKGCIHAGIDSSDGLGKALLDMAFGVKIDVIELPTDNDVLEFSHDMGLNAEEIVFSGGEEFVPIYAVDPNCADLLEDLGFVKFAIASRGEGVFVMGRPLRYRGWSYFKGWG